MKNFKSILKVLISLGLGVGVIIWFWNAMPEEDKNQTIDAFKRANYFYLLIAPLIGFIANFIRTQRWILLLRPLNCNPSYYNTFHSVMVMYFFNLFVPRLGEVMRCSILAKYEDVPVEKSLGTMVTERVVDVICLGIIILIVIVFLGKENYDILKENMSQATSGFSDNTLFTIIKFAMPVLIILGVLVFSWIYIKKNGFDKLQLLVRSKIKSMLSSVMSIKDVKEKPQFIILTILMWLAYLIMFYVNYFSLPETKNLPIFSALVCLVFGSFAVVLTPGGIGVFPIVVQLVLVTFKVNPSIALALGMLAWVVQTSGMLLGGILSLILLNLGNKNKASTVV